MKNLDHSTERDKQKRQSNETSKVILKGKKSCKHFAVIGDSL